MFVKSLLEIPSQQQLKMFMVIDGHGLQVLNEAYQTPPSLRPKRDVISAWLNQRTTGKVIPELKFAFWQNIFTNRHD